MDQKLDLAPQGAHVLVLGASPNPSRYSYACAGRLLAAGFQVTALGRRVGQINGRPILTELAEVEGPVDTVTVYLSEENQEAYRAWLLSAEGPRRVIFNPGAENPTLASELEAKGRVVLEACTLVMLSTRSF